MTTTQPHGMTTTTTTTGFDMHRRGQLVGRVQFRKTYAGQWAADCYAFDGQTWSLERRTSPAGLRHARQLAAEWTERVDAHLAAMNQ